MVLYFISNLLHLSTTNTVTETQICLPPCSRTSNC